MRGYFTPGVSCRSLVLIAVVFGLFGCNDVSSVTAPPPPPSPDSQLSSLTVTPGTLNPAFAGTTTSYTVDETSDITSVTVSAQTQNSGATVSINGGTATASQASQSVTLGGPGTSTPISIVVTAPSGTQNTYIVTVTRASLNGNNSLQNLTISPGTLSPSFDQNTLNYSDDVANTVTSVNVTATLQDANATMAINGQPTNSGQIRNIVLNPPGTSTTVSIAVTARNGSQKTYVVTVNRAGLATDDNLSALSVSPGALSPSFSPSTLNYTVAEASSVTSVTVSATKSDPNATMSGSLTAGPGTAGASAVIPLGGAGTTTVVSITVTAANGTTSQTYTIAVTRSALSSNNNLSALSVSAGALTPAFAPTTLNYTVTAPTGTSTTTVTATVADSSATLKINGSAATSGQAFGPIVLVPGQNPAINIDVTAQNGTTTQRYTVTITVK